jgi:release factor glutamine methyltransferase
LSQNEERIWTIRRALVWTSDDFKGRGISSARLDAELLISRALGVDRVGLYTDLERPLQHSELSRIRELVIRRRKHEPVAYILGEKEFFGRLFDVTPDVLIPRPDTETVVDRILRVCEVNHAGRVLDLGTGSGAIAITVAAERPSVFVDASDISKEALTVAARNAKKHGVDERVDFYLGDLFDALSEKLKFSGTLASRTPVSYDVIVSNPPYIADGQWESLSLDIREFEPQIALRGGIDGLDFYGRLCGPALDLLSSGGVLMLEVGQGQAPAVIGILQSDSRWGEITTHMDFAGIDRVVQARKRAITE